MFLDILRAKRFKLDNLYANNVTCARLGNWKTKTKLR